MNSVALVKAAGVLTATANFTANDTVIAGGKTYKFVATPAAEYDVDIGGTLTVSLANLALAMNGTGTPGATTYFAGTLPVYGYVATSTATTLTLTARLGGLQGNSGEFREGTDGGTAFSITTAMSGGTGDFQAWLTSEIALNQLNSEVLRDLKTLTEGSD